MPLNSPDLDCVHFTQRRQARKGPTASSFSASSRVKVAPIAHRGSGDDGRLCAAYRVQNELSKIRLYLPRLVGTLQGRYEMESRRAILSALAVIGLAGLFAGTQSPAKAEGKIVIYAAEDEKTLAALTKMFTEKTGINTEVIRIPAAGTLAARIRAEKDAP